MNSSNRLIDRMLENFKKISLFNPYHDFVAYFVPVLIIFMYGYYANYSGIQTVFQYSASFDTIINVLLILIVLTAMGKVIFEIFSHIITWVYIVLYGLGSYFQKKSGFLSKVGEKLIHLVPEAGHEEIPATKLNTYFDGNPLYRVWYARIRMYALAIQTGFGASLIAAVLYPQDSALMFLLALVTFTLTLGARRNLLEAEIEIEHTLSNNNQ